MSKFQHNVMLRIVKVLDVLMIELPFAACWFLYYSEQIYKKVGWKGNLTILALFYTLYIVIGRIYDAFSMSNQRVSEMVYGQILGAMATDGIMYIVICLMSGKLCNLWPGIAAIAGQLIMATVWALLANKGITWHSRRRKRQSFMMYAREWKSSSASMGWIKVRCSDHTSCR